MARLADAIIVDAVEQYLPRSKIFHALCQLHGIDVTPFTATLHGALPPAVLLSVRA
jgi:hypothetical protein